MESNQPMSERQRRLQYHNEMKPVYKKILGMTLRGAYQMMKLVVKGAFQIPGLVKKLSSHPKAGSDGSGRDLPRKAGVSRMEVK